MAKRAKSSRQREQVLTPKQAKAKAAREKREAKYAAVVESWCRAHLIPYPPVPEYRFHPTRQWRIDWSWPEYRIGIEIQGGGPRHHHASRKGVENDYAKTCTAQVMGWRIFPMTPRQFAGPLGRSIVRALFEAVMGDRMASLPRRVSP